MSCHIFPPEKAHQKSKEYGFSLKTVQAKASEQTETLIELLIVDIILVLIETVMITVEYLSLSILDCERKVQLLMTRWMYTRQNDRN